MKRLSLLVAVCLLAAGCGSKDFPRPTVVDVAYKASVVTIRIKNAGAAGDIKTQLKAGDKEVQASTETFQKDEERVVTLSLSGVAGAADLTSLDVWLNSSLYATLDLKTGKWSKVT